VIWRLACSRITLDRTQPTVLSIVHIEHPNFIAPENPHTWIWRYVDVARFLAMLTTRSLYLCRADLLGDPFEGTISKATVDSYNDRRSISSLPGFQETMRQFRESLRRNVAISCWHIAECESTAMWNTYAAKGSGIAIRTTYPRILDSLASCPVPTFIGKVNYVDYETAIVGTPNFISPFVHKRREFESERELRIVTTRVPTTKQGDDSVLDYSLSLPPGVLAPIDLEAMIERIVLAPQTADWQANTLRSVVESLGHSFTISRSALDSEAILG
jgi:hypothetical protein